MKFGGGEGTVWVQTRNLRSLADQLIPLLPTPKPLERVPHPMNSCISIGKKVRKYFHQPFFGYSAYSAIQHPQNNLDLDTNTNLCAE